MRFHFVVNPVAGRRRARSLAAAVVERLLAAGHAATSHETTGVGDARAHVASLPESACDRLVVAGGDGTLREVVNSRAVLPWPIGVLPVGTANLVSREVALPLPRDPDLLFEGLLRAQPWPVGLLEIHRPDRPTERAVATIGAGLDGDIVHRVAQARAHASEPGTGGYRQWVRPITGALGGARFPIVEATLDGTRTYRGSAVILQRARTYGGIFTLTPGARLDSEVVEVVVVRARSRRDLLRLIVGAWRGRLARYHDLVFRAAREVTIRALHPIAVQADGDAAGTTDLFVRLVPRAVTLLRLAPVA